MLRFRAKFRTKIPVDVVKRIHIIGRLSFLEKVENSMVPIYDSLFIRVDFINCNKYTS